MSEVNLVTGANGYIGSRLCRRLKDMGLAVRGIDLNAENQTGANIDYRTCDITDTDGIRHACRGVASIYHTAALVPISRADRSKHHRVNVEGTVNVLEAARLEGAKNFCYLASSAVFGKGICDGRPTAPMAEHTPFEPYGLSKSVAEKKVLEFASSDGPAVTIVRPRTVLGPGRLGIFSLFFGWASRHQPLFLIGKGTNRLQFTHVDDVIEVMVRAVSRNKRGVFQVGASKFQSIRQDLVDFCARVGSRSRVVGLPPRIVVPLLRGFDFIGASPLTSWHYISAQLDEFLDTTDTQRELNWQPGLSNVDMLEEAYRWYLSNRHRGAGETSPHRKPLRCFGVES